MTRRRIAASGDRTTTGGRVLSGTSLVNMPTGQAVRLGDEVWCPACQQTGRIAQGYTGWMVDNRPVALDDYPIHCGCPEGTHRIIATNNFIFVNDSPDSIVYLPKSSFPPAKVSASASSTASFSSLNSSRHSTIDSLYTANNIEQKNAIKVFAKSCSVDKECSDAATEKEPVTNFGTMLIYGLASAFSSTSRAHHPSLLPHSADNQTPAYPVNGGIAGAVPAPVIVPTPAGPMISFAPMPVATYPSPDMKIPSLFNHPESAFLVSAAAIKSANTGQSFSSAFVGMMIAEFFSDKAQYDDTELRDLAQIQGYAKTRVRFFFEHDKQTSLLNAYGLHTVEGTRYENVRVRAMHWSRIDNHYEFTESGERKPTIIWKPANPAGSDIPTNTGYPAPNNGEFNQPVIHIHPIHEFDKGSNVEGLPLLDPKNFNDYILVFPADSGIPPIYVYFSKPYGETTAIGRYSNRPFNPDKAGGEILDLDWRTAEITKEGIELVKLHASRFGYSAANEVMIERLEKILTGELAVTDIDKRFYTHEIRELERFRNLGIADNYKMTETPTDQAIWNNTHTATLEDYKVYDKKQPLYTPEADQAEYEEEMKNIRRNK